MDQRAEGSGSQVEEVAALLSEASPGRAKPLWSSLSNLQGSVGLCAGENDQKYVDLANKMKEVSQQNSGTSRMTLHSAEGAGHAVHVERPEIVVDLIHAALIETR